jgi:hypothetical protein
MYEILSMSADSFYGFANNSNHLDKGTLWVVDVYPEEEVMVRGRIPMTYDAYLSVKQVRVVRLDGNPVQVRMEASLYLEDGRSGGSSTTWYRKDETIYYVVSDKVVSEADFQIAEDGTTPINKVTTSDSFPCLQCGQELNSVKPTIDHEIVCPNCGLVDHI